MFQVLKQRSRAERSLGYICLHSSVLSSLRIVQVGHVAVIHTDTVSESWLFTRRRQCLMVM